VKKEDGCTLTWHRRLTHKKKEISKKKEDALGEGYKQRNEVNQKEREREEVNNSIEGREKSIWSGLKCTKEERGETSVGKAELGRRR